MGKFSIILLITCTSCSRLSSPAPSDDLSLSEPVIINEAPRYRPLRQSVSRTSSASYPERHYSLEDEDYQKEESREKRGCGGIISCTVDGIGFVLALPFKLVGGLISVIF